jgi:hypothetical protein
MQAIVTKYISATNTKGSRIKATCAAGSLTVHWDHELSVEGNHEAAAKELVRQLDWTVEAGYKGSWVGGCVPNGDYVFVLAGSDTGFSV